VLASDIPPNHDAVNAGENGGFFPVGDLAAMEQAILGVLPAGERLRLGEASREFALRFFDQEAAARELIAAITSP
jgi:glycosyltransferase involved in cell wall biosynthesis